MNVYTKTADFGRSRDWGRARLWCVVCVFAAIWLGLWVRAGYLQLWQGAKLASMARRQHLSAEFETGRRGEILDRHGRVLAKTLMVNSIYARPLEVQGAYKTAARLAPVLGEPVRVLAAKLRSRSNFVWLARQVGDKAAAGVRAADLPGVHVTSESRRLYPNKHLAGQLLGFVGVDGKGLEGLEQRFQRHLSGRKARFVVARDGSGERLFLDQEGREVDIDGRDVTLTIDAHIQDMAESALARTVTTFDGRAGMCLVVEVDSGDILAWAHYPFFNPNVFRREAPRIWRNRVTLDVFEPGSTIKPLLFAAALQKNVVAEDTPVHCENGRWSFSGETIRDSHSYGWLPVHDVLTYSSNIGAAKVGLLLGARTYHAYLRDLGFGQAAGLPLPGEARGILRPGHVWNDFDLAAASFGQGIGVTTVQLAQGFLSLAAGGLCKPLRLVRDPAGESGTVKRVFDENVAAKVRQMMIDVVESDGTGARARIPGMVMAGKTGTAQKAGPDGGYGERHVSSFVGFVPGDDPRYLILAVVDEPHPQYYGGVVVAPLVREVALKSLGYLGELPETTLAGTRAEGQEDFRPRHGKGRARGRVVREPTPADWKATEMARVPDVVGMPLRRAAEMFISKGITPRLEGHGGRVARQSPASDSPWPDPDSRRVTLWLEGDGP